LSSFIFRLSSSFKKISYDVRAQTLLPLNWRFRFGRNFSLFFFLFVFSLIGVLLSNTVRREKGVKKKKRSVQLFFSSSSSFFPSGYSFLFFFPAASLIPTILLPLSLALRKNTILTP